MGAILVRQHNVMLRTYFDVRASVCVHVYLDMLYHVVVDALSVIALRVAHTLNCLTLTPPHRQAEHIITAYI